jgi:hypothetical protein
MVSPDHPLAGRVKKISNCFVNFYRTAGALAGPALTNYSVIPFDEKPYTGEKMVGLYGGYKRRPTIKIFVNDPWPFNVLSLEPQMEIGN